MCGVITHSAKEIEQQKEEWKWGVGGDREVGGEGGQNLGDIHILGVLASRFQLCKETSKIFHPPL